MTDRSKAQQALGPWSTESLLAYDREHVWHPYSSFIDPPPMIPVVSASGVRLTLADGRQLIDGMASWWSAIHGYGHPALLSAMHEQLDRMSHVMFGGITHPAAVSLARQLVDITPASLQQVFFSDSGSVAVEVAIKMALQYWHETGRPEKHRLLALRNGYHGDTFAAMSVCDPVTGMHHLFSEVLSQQLFVDAPGCDFAGPCRTEDVAQLEATLAQHHDQIAALILEPIVQGTGGMNFYSADYLRAARALCDRYEVLLIADEIATGFGRTGALFACEHAGIEPDILCLGKTLTGGMMTLAATLCSKQLAGGICAGEAQCFMHGPTYMANPLACTAAHASIELLLSQDWQTEIRRLEQQLQQGLAPARQLANVADVRVLGGIGVIELRQAVDLRRVQPLFVEAGVWVRPFGRLVYVMPPYIMSNEDLATLTAAMCKVVAAIERG